MKNDPSQNPGAGQGQAQPAGQAQNQPGSAQEEPKWLQYIPEAERAEAKKGWMLEADYRKKTSEASEQRKQWEQERQQYEQYAQRAKQYEDWFQNEYTPYIQRLKPYEQQIAALLNGQQQPADMHQVPQGDDPYARWEYMTPQEQAKYQQQVIVQQVADNYIVGGFNKLQQWLNDQIATREKYYQNYLNLFVDGFDRRAKDPEFNLQAYMQNALKAQMGMLNPMEVGEMLTNQERTKAQLIAEGEKRGREALQAELDAQNAARGTTQGHGIFPSTLQTLRAQNKKPNVEDVVRQKFTQKYGQGFWE